jgi:hypothetical protein
MSPRGFDLVRKADIDETNLSIAALALICVIGSARAQDFSAEDLARRTVERRAIEAVIWGMPAVNYDLMYQAMVRETKGTFNQIVYLCVPKTLSGFIR